MVDGKQLPANTSMAHVTPGYFSAVGAPVVEGSTFTRTSDTAPEKAVILNQTMARLLYPDGRVIGRHVEAPRCHAVTFSKAAPYAS